METNIATTPFGRRPMSLALFTARNDSRDLPPGKAVDKWQLYRWLCEGKSLVGIGDRALAVLNALLSFYPDNELTEENGLIVFPSNAQLSMRAHGMADATLRRHLAALVDCGVVLRRDSPNGKRFARKGRGGEVEEAFGFSLAPLLARAEEFQQAAEQVRAEMAGLRLMRERITLHRRDIHKLIEAAVEEGAGGGWPALWRRFRSIVEAIPRRAGLAEMRGIVRDLEDIRLDVDKLLETHLNSQNSGGNESQSERQHHNSNTESYFEFEPGFEQAPVKPAGPRPDTKRQAEKSYPIGLVLKACPEITDYAVDGINNWRDLMGTAAQVRGYLGISPSAYAEALGAIGQENTAIVIACILQRANHITSAGGYLRVLTDKARAGEFSVGPMLMAALRANQPPSKMAG